MHDAGTKPIASSSATKVLSVPATIESLYIELLVLTTISSEQILVCMLGDTSETFSKSMEPVEDVLLILLIKSFFLHVQFYFRCRDLPDSLRLVIQCVHLINRPIEKREGLSVWRESAHRLHPCCRF